MTCANGRSQEDSLVSFKLRPTWMRQIIQKVVWELKRVFFSQVRELMVSCTSVSVYTGKSNLRVILTGEGSIIIVSLPCILPGRLSLSAVRPGWH